MHNYINSLSFVLFSTDGRPVMVVQPEDTDINIIYGNENVTLQCAALGAEDYLWERRDGTLPNNAIMINQELQSTLVITHIRREDAGQYRCVADGRGSRNSRYAHVTVTGRYKVIH